jgi:hypothetical protein
VDRWLAIDFLWTYSCYWRMQWLEPRCRANAKHIPAEFEIRGNMSNLVIENPSMVRVSEVEVSPADKADAPPPKANKVLRNWVVMACLLLSISGGIRYWRERQFEVQFTETKKCPFPLNEIPSVLGTWHATGAEAHLDPETLRLAGSSDHILRSYTDSQSGETVSLLVVYGLAHSVFGHTPEVCYPASGYKAVGKRVDHEFTLPGAATPVQYRSHYFTKTVASVTQANEVFWSFWHAGAWLPDLADRWKLFRSSPALFKIQVQGAVTGFSSDHPPVESLIKELVQEINTRRERATAAPAKGSTGVQTAG